MFKKHFSCALWLGILNLPLAWFYSLAYTPQGETPWFVSITFIFALTGQLFIYFALCSIILIFPVFNWRKHIGSMSFIYAVFILVVFHLLLNIDSNLFALYDHHLIDFINGIRDHGIDWSSVNWVHWGIQLVIAVAYSCVMLGMAIVLSSHGIRCRIFAIIALLMYLLSSAIFMFANSRQVEPLVNLETKNLPGFINIGQILSDKVESKLNATPKTQVGIGTNANADANANADTNADSTDANAVAPNAAATAGTGVTPDHVAAGTTNENTENAVNDGNTVNAGKAGNNSDAENEGDAGASDNAAIENDNDSGEEAQTQDQTQTQSQDKTKNDATIKAQAEAASGAQKASSGFGIQDQVTTVQPLPGQISSELAESLDRSTRGSLEAPLVAPDVAPQGNEFNHPITTDEVRDPRDFAPFDAQ